MAPANADVLPPVRALRARTGRMKPARGQEIKKTIGGLTLSDRNAPFGVGGSKAPFMAGTPGRRCLPERIALRQRRR
jgi:hypothetical protein